MAKISTLSFEKICKGLGGVDKFTMHYDHTDAQRCIYSEKNFNEVRETLMKKYGDVEIELNPDAAWFDMVKIIDTKWKEDARRFEDMKLYWCTKYGSN